MRFEMLIVSAVVIIGLACIVSVTITNSDSKTSWEGENYTFVKEDSKVKIYNNKDLEAMMPNYEEPEWLKWCKNKKIDFKFQLTPKFRLIFIVDDKVKEINLEGHFTEQEKHDWIHWLSGIFHYYEYNKEKIDRDEEVNLLHLKTTLTEKQTKKEEK